MMAIKKSTALLAAAALLLLSQSADARPHYHHDHYHHHHYHHHHVHFGFGIVAQGAVTAPYVYDPLWELSYPFGAYSAPDKPKPNPDDAASYDTPIEGDVLVHVSPQDTEIYVDRFYAGIAGDFDGLLRQLEVTTGEHDITLYLDGYRTVTHHVDVKPGAFATLDDTMERLPAGQMSQPVAPPYDTRVLSLRP